MTSVPSVKGGVSRPCTTSARTSRTGEPRGALVRSADKYLTDSAFYVAWADPAGRGGRAEPI